MSNNQAKVIQIIIYTLIYITNKYTKHKIIINQTIEAKKDEFRTYLEKSGVVDNLTRVLVSLYEESDKPQSALE